MCMYMLVHRRRLEQSIESLKTVVTGPWPVLGVLHGNYGLRSRFHNCPASFLHPRALSPVLRVFFLVIIFFKYFLFMHA